MICNFNTNIGLNCFLLLDNSYFVFVVYKGIKNLMNISKILYILFFVFIHWLSHSQKPYNNTRNYETVFSGDTLILDSLSIVPQSFRVLDSNGNDMDSSMYSINYAKAILIRKDKQMSNVIRLSYRTFPFSFTKKIQHKQLPSSDNTSKTIIFSLNNDEKNVSPFRFDETEGLQKSGSISRSVSIGNSQDLSVSSELNMQLSGMLNNEIEIKAVITDNNIPIQPDGNTQQIQEFDRVFIELNRKQTKLVAGDFTVDASDYHFFKMRKKVQGALFSTKNYLNQSDTNRMMLNNTVSGAIAKGKYAKAQLNSIEGNQGPYKLYGMSNELYVVVLAGSEKVYMDGVLLERGSDKDYIMDYNNAEIIFNPNVLVTKDKRIVVEYEYSDRNYARSMLFTEHRIGNEKFLFKIAAYNEQDIKSQPIDLTMDKEDKLLLSKIGDSTSLANIFSGDSVAFNNNKVLYKMVDTVVQGFSYDSVLVYSINSDSAYYEVAFSYVGTNNGDYVQAPSAANGRVFRWVAPINGIPQGTYQPISILPAPQRKQMYVMSGDAKLSKHLTLKTEMAVTHTDLNLFSDKDDGDNAGMAARIMLENKIPVFKSQERKWFFISGMEQEYTGYNFSPVEPFKNTEYNRDWNIGNIKSNHESLSGMHIGLEAKDKGKVRYAFLYLQKDTLYKGYQHSSKLNYNVFRYFLDAEASILQTRSYATNSQFLRSRSSLQKKLKPFTIGVRSETEDNRFTDLNDSLMNTSYKFFEWQYFFHQSDTSKQHFGANYTRRLDYSGFGGKLRESTLGESVSSNLGILAATHHNFNVIASYRKLKILDTIINKDEPDENFAGRLEYNSKWLHEILVLQTFYETGTGQEVKKEFSYVEVSPGQGIYKWTDYNNNNVKELDEFDISVFQDEANYLRFYIPTNEYIKSYSNQYSQAYNLDAHKQWSKLDGFKKMASRFSLQGYYNIKQKSTNKEINKAFNPLYNQINDSSLLSYNSSFKNTVFFNRRSQKWSLDWMFRQYRTKLLMVNGFELRTHVERQWNCRWNITREWTLKQEYVYGTESAASQYFNTRDFYIYYSRTLSKLVWQPSLYFSVAGSFSYQQKQNEHLDADELAIKRLYGSEIKYNSTKKSLLFASFNYVIITYNALTNTPLAFEMLDALKPGVNTIWNINYQRNISRHLQLMMRYDGRKSPGNNMIHVGTIQLRAYF